jgi:hypothetical protein
VAASRRSGVDVVSGVGLAKALKGASVAAIVRDAPTAIKTGKIIRSSQASALSGQP